MRHVIDFDEIRDSIAAVVHTHINKRYAESHALVTLVDGRYATIRTARNGRVSVWVGNSDDSVKAYGREISRVGLVGANTWVDANHKVCK